jgi:hypothetical protein
MMSIAVQGVDTGLERAARREVDALGRQVVFRATPLRDLVNLRMLRERMVAVVTSAYGLVTLAVVGVGLYGLMIIFGGLADAGDRHSYCCGSPTGRRAVAGDA